MSSSSDEDIELVDRIKIGENDVFLIYFDSIRDKSGLEVAAYLSVIPKSLSENAAIGVAVLPVKEGRIGLRRVFRHPMARSSWEIPRGFIEPGESSASAARRELCEEFGADALAKELINLGTVTPESGVILGRVYIYAAILSSGKNSNAGKEIGHGLIRYFESTEVLGMMEGCEIEDSYTLIAILKYLRR